MAEWGVRGSVALAAVLLGYVSVARTTGYLLRESDPKRAASLAPDDGRVIAQFAAKLSGPDATLADRARADNLARRALRQDATAVAAVSTLGINAQLRNESQGARQLFAYSEALSRRDLKTQLWGIEDAVARGDVASAMRHYDVALRTSRNAPELLFPILAGAIGERPVRAALVATLARRPNWSALFVENVAANGANPRATMMLFRELRQVNFPVTPLSQGLLINTLASRDMFAEAWSYYASVRLGADRRMSRDSDFAANLASPTVFDWTAVNGAGITASLQGNGNAGVVDFTATASVGGPLLRQVQLLPPGDYRLEGRSAGIDQPESSRPYWTLACLDGRELGRVVLPNSPGGQGPFAGRFAVPAGCPVQMLTLVARPSDAMLGLSGQIYRARLYPLR